MAEDGQGPPGAPASVAAGAGAPPPGRWTRALLGVLAGAALAHALLPRGVLHEAGADACEVWVLDQGAGRLAGLDARGRPGAELALGSSGAAARGAIFCSDAWGALWHVSFEVPGASRVRRVAPPAARAPPALEQARLEELSGRLLDDRVRALAPLATGALALVGAEGEAARLVHLARHDLGTTVWLERTAATCLAAGSAGRFLLADAAGTLQVFERGERTVLRAQRRLAGRWSALAAGPAGGWWALGAGRHGRLLSLSADLGVAREILPGIAGEDLAAWPGAAWVWVIDPAGVTARRYAQSGALLAAAGPWPLGEVRAAAALPGGELWIAGPGAVLRLSAAGEATAAQGGFEKVSGLAVAAVAGRGSPPRP